MSALAISGIVFVCILGAAVLGSLINTRLPEHHLSGESKDVVKLGMGLVGTMTALVLGLLVASAKGAYDTQRTGVAQLAGYVIMLDRTLAHYGPETKELREQLRAALADFIRSTWPDEEGLPDRGGTGTEGRYEDLYDKIQELAPKTEAQRQMQAQALRIAMDTGQARWQLYTRTDSSIPPVFLVVLIAWLALILLSFGLFAPRNALAVAALAVCAVVVSSSIFLILELDQPLQGVLRIPSAPVRAAYQQLGR
jgi:hypothetical protein